MAARAPSFGSFFGHLQAQQGLYVLGAGASAGLVPLSNGLLREAAQAHIRRGAYSTVRLLQSRLTRKSVAAAMGRNRDGTLSAWSGGRIIRLGTEDSRPLEELLLRQSDIHTEMHMLHLIAKPVFLGLNSDNYRGFCRFHPGVILNYNHDGLASYWCRPRHQVLVAHGTVEPWFGSTYVAEYPERAGMYDLPVPPHNLLLCLPESESEELKRTINGAFMPLPNFVAMIGYSLVAMETPTMIAFRGIAFARGSRT